MITLEISHASDRDKKQTREVSTLGEFLQVLKEFTPKSLIVDQPRNGVVEVTIYDDYIES